MSTTITQIKELRERTGVGMNKCKEALEACSGNIDEAIDYLRKQGVAQAVKKEGRETKEGAIGIFQNDDALALVELNAETDFVVKGDIFQNFLSSLAQRAAEERVQSAEELMQKASKNEKGMTLDEERAVVIQSIGENIQVKRVKTYEKKANHSYGAYSHMGGKIACMTEIQGAEDQAELAREVAMHSAAARPEFLNPESVPESAIEKERDIAKAQMEGKPEHLIENILKGKVNAYFKQVCLSEQEFIKDSKLSIKQLLEKEGKAKGQTLSLTAFERWEIGG